MELKELYHQSFQGNFRNPFALISCCSNDNHYAIIGSQKTAIFLTMQNTVTSTETLNIAWDSVISPTHIPTSFIVQNIDMSIIYEKSSTLERQSLVLDPRYATEFARTPRDSQIVCISWPSLEQLKLENIVLAVISHYGTCELFTKDSIKNEFSISRILINDLLKEIFDSNINNNIKTFEILRNYIENFCLTYCCWTNLYKSEGNDCKNYGQLLCSTESGWIIMFDIIPWKAEFLYKFMTNLKSIKYFKAFSFQAKKSEKNFLFVSNASGILKIYEIHKSEIKEITTLWGKEDKMSCRSIDVSYHQDIDKLLVATTKGAHILVYVLSSDGQIYKKTHHYIGNLMITGIEIANPFEYILSTINGYIEHIHVTFNDNDDLIIKSDGIKHDLMIENNQILGMIATPNKVGWLFVLYRNKYKEKNSSYLSLCSLNVIEPLDVLLNSKNYFMEKYFDCNEVIRLKLICEKEYEKGNYMKFSLEPIQMTEEFSHRLRIRKIIVNGIAASYRKKLKSQPLSIEKELECIDDTIYALYSCDRLKYLINLKNLSEFQNLSGKYIRRKLVEYAQKDLIEQYANVRNVLLPIIDSFLIENENAFDDEHSNEVCVYCNEEIDPNSMMCNNNHDMTRCCLTLVQVEMFTRRHCPQCKRVALDHDNLLCEILSTNKENFRCPICAIPFISHENVE